MFAAGDRVRLKDDEEGRGVGVVVGRSDTVAESVLVSWARGPKRSHVRLIDLMPAGEEEGPVVVEDLLSRLDALEEAARETPAEGMPFQVGDRVTVADRPGNGVGEVVAFSHLAGDAGPGRVIVRFDGGGPAVHYLPGDLVLVPAGDEADAGDKKPASGGAWAEADALADRLVTKRPRRKACLWCGGRGCVLCS